MVGGVTIRCGRSAEGFRSVFVWNCTWISVGDMDAPGESPIRIARKSKVELFAESEDAAEFELRAAAVAGE